MLSFIKKIKNFKFLSYSQNINNKYNQNNRKYKRICLKEKHGNNSNINDNSNDSDISTFDFIKATIGDALLLAIFNNK